MTLWISRRNLLTGALSATTVGVLCGRASEAAEGSGFRPVPSGVNGCHLMPARDWHKTDCGYPSSVQLDDGTIVTAHYFGPKKPEWAAHGLPWHQRYHMGVARWDLACWPADA